jgi:hypothetical protein
LALSISVMALPSATRSPATIALAVASRSLREACLALMDAALRANLPERKTDVVSKSGWG